MKIWRCKKAALFLTGIGLIAACSIASQKAKDTILFSHHVHSEQGLECAECHKNLEKDAEVKVEALPDMAACADCHDIENEKECKKCHTNPDDPGTYDITEKTNLNFSHQKHGDHSDDCADCHSGAAHLADITQAKRAIPTHKDCNSCHSEDMEFGRCQKCHDRLDLNPKNPKTIYSHEKGFFEKHGQRAMGAQDQCALCHDQSFCADCHAQTMTVRPSLRYPERVDREFIHQGDWISRHVIEARMGDTGCMKCHGNTYCASCHEQQGIGGATAKRNPHPEGWEGIEHGRAARRRIQECASCHDQAAASNCVQCHHASGGHIPHPPGWKAPIPPDERSTHKMCKICHAF